MPTGSDRKRLSPNGQRSFRGAAISRRRANGQDEFGHHGFRMNHELPAPIEALFARCPALCGFSVRGIEELPDHLSRGDSDGELFVDDIGVMPMLSREQLCEVFREIASTLAELAAVEPAEALRGRTFARVLH
jgi:hypothetical protein